MTADKFQVDNQETYDFLNSVGCGFCLAKWTQVTIHLASGITHSCHHVGAHKIPLEELKENRNVKMPIFIKPRWGHLSASSKNCFKIKSWEELEQYRHIPDMMWSEFIDATEQMTDYIEAGN